MADGQLSQDEIDALMDGDSPFDFGKSEEKKKKEEKTADFSTMLDEKEEKKELSKKQKSQEKKKTTEAGKISLDSTNMELLLGVNMTLSVELGRTKKNVKEVLSYGEGSIVELEKLSGEPVDILVNNRLIARGEIVVIDESYGVKITEIIDPDERFLGLES